MKRLDAFLRFNEREVLDNLGTVSAAVAEATAIREYEQFDANRRRQEAVADDEEDFAALSDYIDRLAQNPPPPREDNDAR